MSQPTWPELLRLNPNHPLIRQDWALVEGACEVCGAPLWLPEGQLRTCRGDCTARVLEKPAPPPQIELAQDGAEAGEVFTERLRNSIHPVQDEYARRSGAPPLPPSPPTRRVMRAAAIGLVISLLWSVLIVATPIADPPHAAAWWLFVKAAAAEAGFWGAVYVAYRLILRSWRIHDSQ